MRILLYLLFAASIQAAPKLIAHRGASEAAPENTLAAFQQAWKEGADGIEADFRLSKDGRIVCIHDADTKRTTNRKYVVADTNWNELRTLDAGSWKSRRFSSERLPLLAEVLAILPPKKYFFIEIKCGVEIIEPLKKQLEHADNHYVFVISFDPAVIKSCRENLPNIQAHLVSKLEGIRKPGGKEQLIRVLDETQATGIQFKHSAKVSKDILTQIQKAGKLTTAWTVDSSGTANRLAEQGRTQTRCRSLLRPMKDLHKDKGRR